MATDLQGGLRHDLTGMLHFFSLHQCKSNREVMVALCWVIWPARDKLPFKGKRDDPGTSVARAESVVESFKRIKQPEID